jgi:hypothetical protein
MKTVNLTPRRQLTSLLALFVAFQSVAADGSRSAPPPNRRL